MNCKFKYGDRVKAGKHLGKIVSVRKDSVKHTSSGYLCTVKFDNQFLIPSEMEYEEEYICFEYERTTGCPICNTPWHEVKFGNNLWKDCLKCNKKEEDILEMQKNKINTDFTDKTKPPGIYDDDDDDGYGNIKIPDIDDDDDDFGYF